MVITLGLVGNLEYLEKGPGNGGIRVAKGGASLLKQRKGGGKCTDHILQAAVLHTWLDELHARSIEVFFTLQSIPGYLLFLFVKPSHIKSQFSGESMLLNKPKVRFCFSV